MINKKINTYYSILIIIMFTVICFLTDYIIIDRKVNECICEQCVGTNVDYSNNCTPYNNIVGSYTHIFDDKEEFTLILYDDYTFKYIISDENTFLGNYVIECDEVVLNYLFQYGDNGVMKSYDGKEDRKILNITSDGSLYDYSLCSDLSCMDFSVYEKSGMSDDVSELKSEIRKDNFGICKDN